MPQVPDGREKVPDQESIVAAIKAHCDSLSAGDKDAWLDLWAQDCVLEDPVGVDRFEGRDTLATTFWGMIEQISPMKIWLEREIIVCGHEAIAILFGVVSPRGKMTRVGPIVDHFTFDADGKIASMRAFWKYDPAAPSIGVTQAGAV